MVRFAALIVSLLAVAAAAGCGGGEEAPPAAEVDIVDFRFQPKDIEVRVGGAVTFGNGDAAPHTATADNRTDFDTRTLTTGERKQVIFENTGTYSYFCDFHPFMKGEIEVVD